MYTPQYIYIYRYTHDLSLSLSNCVHIFLYTMDTHILHNVYIYICICQYIYIYIYIYCTCTRILGRGSRGLDSWYTMHTLYAIYLYTMQSLNVLPTSFQSRTISRTELAPKFLDRSTPNSTPRLSHTLETWKCIQTNTQSNNITQKRNTHTGTSNKQQNR